VGVDVGFAISPGLDIDYTSEQDRAALVAKLDAMLECGLHWFVLAVDDVPNRPGLASEQAALLHHLVAHVGAATDGVRWSFVPTEYVGTRPTPYLSTLAAELPEDVDVCWTGPTVCSPTITLDDARAWREAVGGRPLLVWDNYPVNDTVMERELHLGPYQGRSPDLGEAVDGVLCNPMLQPRASLVALATAAEYLADPDGYRADDAWARAIEAVGGPHAASLRALARACCDGPLAPASTLSARALVDDLARSPGDPARLAAVRAELEELRAATQAWDDDDPLGAELRPWLEQARRECDAGLAAVRLLELVAEPAGADAEPLLLQVFTLLFSWSAAREASTRVVLGPRFALHPAIVQGPDGAPAIDVGLTVREDQSAIDAVARLALDAYATTMS